MGVCDSIFFAVIHLITRWDFVYRLEMQINIAECKTQKIVKVMPKNGSIFREKSQNHIR